jgi:hypothetical protein
MAEPMRLALGHTSDRACPTPLRGLTDSAFGFQCVLQRAGADAGRKPGVILAIPRGFPALTHAKFRRCPSGAISEKIIQDAGAVGTNPGSLALLARRRAGRPRPVFW